MRFEYLYEPIYRKHFYQNFDKKLKKKCQLKLNKLCVIICIYRDNI